jgi:hypothetical protein
MSNYRFICLVFSAFFFAIISVLGADPATPPIDRPPLGDPLSGFAPFDNQTQTRAPSTPGDEDLGEQIILPREKAAADYYQLFLSSSVQWTNNTAEIGVPRREAWMWASRFGLLGRPPLTEDVWADIRLSTDIYRYDRGTPLDYETLDTALGVMARTPWDDGGFLGARFEYQRFTGGSWNDELYGATRFVLEWQRNWTLAPDHTLFFSAQAAWDISSNPDDLERSEYSVYLGYGWEITEKLRFIAMWNPSWLDYREGGRSDWLHIVGGGLEYRFSQGVQLQGLVFFTSNHSNTDIFDYDSLQLGVGLNLSLAF